MMILDENIKKQTSFTVAQCRIGIYLHWWRYFSKWDTPSVPRIAFAEQMSLQAVLCVLFNAIRVFKIRVFKKLKGYIAEVLAFHLLSDCFKYHVRNWGFQPCVFRARLEKGSGGGSRSSLLGSNRLSEKVGLCLLSQQQRICCAWSWGLCLVPCREL